MSEVNLKQVVYAPAERFPCPWCSAEEKKSFIKFTEKTPDDREVLIEGLAVDDWGKCPTCGRGVQVVKMEQRWFIAAKPATGEAPTETDQPKAAEITCEKCGISTYDLEAHLAVDEDGVALFCKPKIECPLCGVMTVDLTKHLERDEKNDLVRCVGKKTVEMECPFCKVMTADIKKHHERDKDGKLLYCAGKPYEKPPEDQKAVCDVCGAETMNLANHKRLSCFGPRKS